MILNPYSFAGTLLNSSDYSTTFPDASLDLQVKSQAGYVKRAGATPVYAGKDIIPQTLSLNILMQHDHQTLFESINTLFDTKDETPQQLIVTDSEDSDKQYYVYATPQQVMGGGSEGNMVTVILALDDPIWQSVTQNSQTWTITSSTSTTDVTINGNDDSYPIFEFSPTSSPSTDFIYSTYIQVLPTSSNPWTARPLCLTGDTGGTWDTAAIVAAGKMQSGGQDVRVYRNGIEQNFWLSGINTTDTKVWVVTDMPEARNMTLKTAIGATDTVTEIEVNYTAANLTAINNMPNTGILIVDSSLGATDTEELGYTAKTITDTKLAFTISARNSRNTLAVAHSVGANVRHMPYGFRISYGNATAAAATVDDTTKPVLNLSTSNNTSFVYSNFFDSAGLRAGAWQPFVRAQSDPLFSRSTHYTSTNDEGDTDPATAMGFKVQTYESGGLYRPDSVLLTWVGRFPDYVTSFSVTGEQNQTASTIPTFGMAYVGTVDDSRTNTLNYLWTVSAQATTDYSTWTAFTKATTDSTVPPNLDTLRWIANGTILGTSDLYAKVGISALTVNLTNNPHVMIRSEVTSAVRINCQIANTTTGESFKLDIPVEVNDTVIVDTDPDFPTVKYNGQIINGAIKLSSVRSAWLKLQPGLNTLTFDNLQSVSNNFTVTIKWRDRANFY